MKFSYNNYGIKLFEEVSLTKCFSSSKASTNSYEDNILYIPRHNIAYVKAKLDKESHHHEVDYLKYNVTIYCKQSHEKKFEKIEIPMDSEEFKKFQITLSIP